MKHTVLNCGMLWMKVMVMSVIVSFYRGKSFRKVFHEIGNLRSLLPMSVNVMALTATVTKETIVVL